MTAYVFFGKCLNESSIKCLEGIESPLNLSDLIIVLTTNFFAY